MAIPLRLAQFLEARKIPYRTETHPEAFTAQQVAQASHVPGKAFAKSVLLSVDGKIWMAVLPATERVDLERVGGCLDARKVRMATESEFAPIFPDCDLGAMPVFGSLYGVPVIVSHELLDGEDFAFTAGTHRDVVRLRTKDYLEAERPQVCGREEILA
jgi:Ala-tRNA(Pro) deacylase